MNNDSDVGLSQTNLLPLGFLTPNRTEKIIHSNEAINKEQLEEIFKKIKALEGKVENFELILYDCQLSFEFPKGVEFSLKRLMPKLQRLKLNLSCNSLKQSFLVELKEALLPNSLKYFSLNLFRCRDLNPDFFKIFDDRLFNGLCNLETLKLNFSDNSKPPEFIDLKFLEKLTKINGLQKLKLDFSKNYFQHWKKFVRILPEFKELRSINLNFYGCKLLHEHLLALCNSLIICEGLKFIKIDLRSAETSVFSKEYREVPVIEAMTSVFREKFNNDPKMFKIWY